MRKYKIKGATLKVNEKGEPTIENSAVVIDEEKLKQRDIDKHKNDKTI